MRPLSALLATLSLLAALAPAAPAADAAFAGAMRSLDLAVVHGKADEILTARAAFAALVADAPATPRYQYGLALATWRVVPLLGKDREPLGRKLCAEGIAACERAIAADPKFADAHAMKAALLGLAIGFSPMSAMSIGPEIVEGNARAMALAPGNPRVQLLAAISRMHEPGFVGGGPKAAKPLFERALRLFDEAPADDTTGIGWGRVDAYVWSGRCLAALGDWAGARDRYRQALAIEPEHAWTARVLLPEAEQHAAAGSRP